MRKIFAQLSCLAAFVAWTGPALAVLPWEWTVSAIPSQVYNSRQAAEGALRALGNKYAFAEVVEYTQVSPYATTYTYGAKARPINIGEWGNYTIQFATQPYHNSEAEQIADVVATNTTSCGAAVVTPTQPWVRWNIGPSGDNSSEMRMYNLHWLNPVGATCEVHDGSIQSWRYRTVECPTYFSWSATETGCVLHNIATIQSKPLECPCSAGSGEGDGPGSYVGNPISTSTGDKFQQETDFKLPWLEFRRTYHSLVQMPYGNLGTGWTHSLNARLSSPSNPTGVTLPNGESVTIDNYVASDGSRRNIEQVSGYEYDWYEGQGHVLAFNSQGRETREDFPDGQHLTFGYDAAGRLASVTHSSGRYVTFQYEGGPITPAASHLTAIMYMGSTGTTLVSYAYDANGNLATVTRADGTVRTYLYENASFPNHLTGILDENGSRFATFSYDAQGRAQSTEHAGGADHYSLTFDASGNATVVTPLNETNTYQFTSDGRYRKPTSIAGSNGTRTWSYENPLSGGGYRRRPLQTTDRRGTVTQYQYAGSTDWRTEAYGSPQQRRFETDYNTSKNLVLERRVRNAASTLISRSTYVYNTRYQVKARCEVDPANATAMSYVCGSATNAPAGVRQWLTTYCESADVSSPGTTNCILLGQVKSIDGPRTDVSDVTLYRYYTTTDESGCSIGGVCHRVGDVWQIENAMGQITTFNNYDLAGRPTSISDANGVSTLLAYDAVGRLLSSNIGAEVTTYEYWPTDLLKKTTLPDGSYVQYGYDAAHRLTQVTDNLGNSVVYTLDAMGNRTAENVYDPSSNLRRTHSRVYNTLNRLYQDVDAASTGGATTTYAYDNNGNQTTVNAPLSRNTTNLYDALNRLKQITDPASGNTYFAYDANDNLSTVTDPKGLVTSYAYNGFGDLITQTSPDTGITVNTYDSGGNLSTSTDARSAIATYTYDALNRVASVAYTKSGVTDQTIAFSYDAGTYGKGRLTGAADANHSMGWVYDAQGRVTSKAQTVGAVALSVGYGFTNGKLTTLTLPSGNVVTYTYDANGQVASIALGATTILSNATYEAFGGVKGWTWGNGMTQIRSYDENGRVTAIGSSDVNGVNLTYGYDSASRITSLSDSGSSPNSWTYGYDAMDRLNSATGPSLTQGWTYDANGNRLTETGTQASTFTVSSTSNRLNSTSGFLTRTYAYDAVGNALTYEDVTLSYNNRNRLASTQKSSSTRSYVYNALGQMVKASGGAGGTVHYAYDEAGHLLGEYDASGALIQETAWLGDTPVATVRAGSPVQVLYVHADHLGTPIRITQPSDNASRWQWKSDPFGTLAADEDPSSLGSLTYNLRFPGQIFDGQAGLHQNWNRDYSPAIGRYAQSDPIGLSGGVNTYSYVASNPISRVDPNGKFWFVIPGICAAGGCEALAAALGIGVAASTPSGQKAIKNAASAVADAVNNRTKCDCDEIAASIEERVSELRVRYVQATVDKGDFFTSRFEGKMGWLTHKAQYEQKQVNLSRLITQARGQGCAYNPEADEWVARPFPNSPARWNSGNK